MWISFILLFGCFRYCCCWFSSFFKMQLDCTMRINGKNGINRVNVSAHSQGFFTRFTCNIDSIWTVECLFVPVSVLISTLSIRWSIKFVYFFDYTTMWTRMLTANSTIDVMKQLQCDKTKMKNEKQNFKMKMKNIKYKITQSLCNVWQTTINLWTVSERTANAVNFDTSTFNSSKVSGKVETFHISHALFCSLRRVNDEEFVIIILLNKIQQK